MRIISLIFALITPAYSFTGFSYEQWYLQYTDTDTKSVAASFIYGIATGVSSASTYQENVGNAKIICRGEDLFFPDDIAQMTAKYVARHPSLSDLPLSIPVTLALIDAFPCEK